MKNINETVIKNMKSFLKIMAKIWPLAVVVGMVLLPQLAFAAIVDSKGVPITPLTPPPGDLSVAFLGKIFGTVGGGLETGTSTVFGKMFYVFNSGILIVIGALLSYTTLLAIIEIAQGSIGQMGRGKFSWWHAARVVLGAGLVVPHATGYSIMNSIVMWVVLQGVGLADAVWTQAVTFVYEGGALYTTPAGGGSEALASLIDARLIYKPTIKSNASSSDILRSSICMNSLYNVVDESRKERLLDAQNNPKNYTKEMIEKFKAPIPRFREKYDIDTKTLIFPGNADEVLPPQEGTATLNLNGKCGAYFWGNVPVTKTGGKDGPAITYMDAKEAGLRQMVLGLSHIADDSINLYSLDSGKNVQDFPTSFHETTYTSLVNTVANYQSIILPIRLKAGIKAPYYEPSKDRFSKLKIDPKTGKVVVIDRITPEDLTSEGWITAGSFYFTLGKLEPTGIMMDDYYAPQVTIAPPRCDAVAYIAQGDVSRRNTTPPGQCSDDDIKRIFNSYLPGKTGKYVAQLEDRLAWQYKELSSASDKASDKGGAKTTVYDKAIALSNQLNEAAQGGQVNLPAELQTFAKRRQIVISVPTAGGLLTMVRSFVLDPLNLALGEVFASWHSIFFVGASTAIDMPIYKLQRLGDTMIKECFGYWKGLLNTIGGALWIFLLGAITGSAASAGLAACSVMGVCIGAQNALQFLLGVTQMMIKVLIEIPLGILMPIIGAVSVLMLLNGVILAYYVPLLPFMLFLFGAISWFSFVIEGMVAAPLVALGLTHPEGHDLLGRAEQALMLLVSIFIRPTAMIIGLIAGIVLSYVALELLNAGFGRIICELFYDGNCVPAAAGGEVTRAAVYKGMALRQAFSTFIAQSGWYALIAMPITAAAKAFDIATLSGPDQLKNAAMIIIYTLIVMALIQQCFSLINTLPSYIMQWIGGPGREGMEAQLAEGVKAGVEKPTERLGGAAGEMARGAAGVTGISAVEAKPFMEKKEKQPAKVGPGETGESSSGPGSGPGGGKPPSAPPAVTTAAGSGAGGREGE